MEKRRVMLSVIGTLILIISVVGVSFAFFTYSRTGEKNNVIQTGSIIVNYEETSSGLYLTNVFPKADNLAYNTTNSGDQVAMFVFRVTGYNTAASKSTLNYSVTAVQGSQSGERVRFPDNHVKLYVVGSKTTGYNGGTINIENGFGTINGNTYGALVNAGLNDPLETTADGGTVLVASGTIRSTDTEAPDIHIYTLRMWVSNAVTISDSEVADYCASANCTHPGTVYNNLYYSLKINVSANA